MPRVSPRAAPRTHPEATATHLRRLEAHLERLEQGAQTQISADVSKSFGPGGLWEVRILLMRGFSPGRVVSPDFGFVQMNEHIQPYAKAEL